MEFRVSSKPQRLEITVNTSRILTLDKNIPRIYVNNPDIVLATPLTENQVQVSGLKPGVTQVNMYDMDGKVYTVDVVVMRDASELTDLLKTLYPEATLRVIPLEEAVYISGFVPRPEMIDGIVKLAEVFYVNVINEITVGGVLQVAMHVKVMEVSRTKLRQLGMDWQLLTTNADVYQGSAGLMAQAFDADARELIPGIGGDTLRLKAFWAADSFTAYLQALREYHLVKLLAEPTITVMTGRPATISSGGSFPILVPNGLGTTSVEFRDYGTRVDVVPIVLGNGNIRLEIRPRVSEVDETRGVEVNGVKVPGLTIRYTDTSVEMRAGQTLALAGLIQYRTESLNKGIPGLADMPWLGRAFSRVEEHVNEVELLILVTPEIVGAMEPHQVPQCGPGQLTTSPNDAELYWYGYPEVPDCCLGGEDDPSQPRAWNAPPESIPAPREGANPLPGQNTAPLPQRSVIPNAQVPTDQTEPSPSPTSASAAGGRISHASAPPRANYRSRPRQDSGASEVGLFGPLGYDPLD
jgi:pilus assembly protein CpaC